MSTYLNQLRRHLQIFCLFCLLILLVLNNTTAAAPISKKASVKIPLLDWSSQRVISRAIGEELTNNGFTVEYSYMSEEVLWGALARGKVHFQIEIWQASASNEFQDMISKNRIQDIGLHSAVTMEDWWYPDYVEKLCPGLPDWRALNNCAALFSDGDSTKGNYLTGPWPYRDADLIRSLSLDFKIKRYQDMEQIWEELEKAKAEKRPIVLLNWTPNWSDDRLSGKFVKFPAYAPECETDPSWGVNPKLAFDCANVPNGWIKKAAWVDFKNKFPCVYQFVRNIDLNNEMIAEAAALVDYDKVTEQEAVSQWRRKYHQKIQTWSNDSCIESDSK